MVTSTGLMIITIPSKPFLILLELLSGLIVDMKNIALDVSFMRSPLSVV